jgi:iron complex transport system substrate-binding protein
MAQRRAAKLAAIARALAPSLAFFLVLVGAGKLVAAAPAFSDTRPKRIVSLDLCTDQLLIELADGAQIAAVTHLAADPDLSAIPQKARGFAVTHGGAEDVLRYDPDLILAGPFGVAASVALLRRLDRNVLVVPLPRDLDGVRTAVRLVAAAVGATPKGEAMIADFDRRLPLPSSSRHPPSAVLYQPGGAVSLPGSLAAAALAAAGLRNLAPAYPLTRDGQVPLESLLVMPPDLLVLGSGGADYPDPLPGGLSHPALHLLFRHRPTLALPWRDWLCGTPHIADAIVRLARMRELIEQHGR